jgi:tetratricopeptide (TPR) repeat protein
MGYLNNRLKRFVGPGLYCLVPLLLTVVVYYGAWNASFTNWDDDAYVVDNPIVRETAVWNLERMFSPHTLVCGNYQPATILSLALNYAAGGLNPAGYIAVNILLHLLNVLLVFAVIRKISGSDRIACACAMLFGIHPLHVESVAWTTGRKDVLYAFFYLSALLCYLRYREKRGGEAGAAYGAALVLFVISLLSKSAAVTFPATALLIDYYRHRPFSKKMVLDKIPFLVGAIIIGILAIHGQRVTESFAYGAHLTVPGRILMGCYSFMFYVVKFIAPVNLSAFYPYPVGPLPASWPLWYKLAPIGVAAVAGGAFYFRRNRDMVFGMLFFTITIIFLVHVVPVGKTITADRFSYLPYVGLSFILAYGLERLSSGMHFRHASELPLVIPVIIVIALLSFAAHERCRVWKDSITLWKDVIEKDRTNPDAAFEGNEHIGAFLLERGRIAEAADYLRTSLKFNPTSPLAHDNLGMADAAAGKLADAASEYHATLQTDPDDINALINLGNLAADAGRHEEAIAFAGKAVKLDSTNASICYNLGCVLQGAGRQDEAIACFRKALAFHAEFSGAAESLADALRKTGRFGEAIAQYRLILKNGPDNAGTRHNLGVALAAAGRIDEAVAAFQRALAMNPGYTECRYDLAGALLQKGRTGEAIALYRAVLAVKPDYPEACNNLGSALMQAGLSDDGIACFRKAVALEPGYAAAYTNLGNALVNIGRAGEAVAPFRRTLAIDATNMTAIAGLCNALVNIGRQGEAVALAKKAVALAHSRGREDLAQAFEASISRIERRKKTIAER